MLHFNSYCTCKHVLTHRPHRKHNDLFIYLFSFPLSGEGHCYRFPQLQQALCSRGGDSPQHRH